MRDEEVNVPDFSVSPYSFPHISLHFQGEASKLKKFKTGLGRKLNDIVGDMQDIRDEGLHSLNELKVEYQVSSILTQSKLMGSRLFYKNSLFDNRVKRSSISKRYYICLCKYLLEAVHKLPNRR